MRKGQHQSDKHCGADYEEAEGYKQLMGGEGGGAGGGGTGAGGEG